MNIKWNVFLTDEGRRTQCPDGKSLDSVHTINQINMFKPLDGHVMEIDDPENCGGSVDLIEHLVSLGLQENNDIMFIDPVGISEESAKINVHLRALADLNIFPILLASDNVYVIPAVLEWNLVEFQVSDGPFGRRGMSHDFYTYSAASYEFDRIVEHGWK